MDTSSTTATSKFQQKYSLHTFQQVSPSFSALHSTRLRRLRLAEHSDSNSASEPSQTRSLWEQIPLQCTHCGHLGGIATRLVRIHTGRTKQTRSGSQSRNSGGAKKDGQHNQGKRCIRRTCGICGHVDDEMICSEDERRLDFPNTRSIRYNAAVKKTNPRVDDTSTIPTLNPHVSKEDTDNPIERPTPKASSSTVGKPSQPSLSRESSAGSRRNTKGKKSGLQEMLQRAREKKATENELEEGFPGS